MQQIPLGRLDHYTLIVDDAADVARFHCEVLGFKHLRIQKVNAGSADPGDHDMLNYVLELPGSTGQVLVVTQGLNERSMFNRYLRAFGAGVHHVAYEVQDIDRALEQLQAIGVQTTSAELLRDPLTGLRQVFLAREHGGYFIEFIERTPRACSGSFTENNMAGLASTMLPYVERAETRVQHEPPSEPHVDIARPRAEVVDFLLDPFNLPRWTAHRTVRRIDGRVVEVRMAGDVALEISEVEGDVHFVWIKPNHEFRVRFAVQSLPGGRSTRVRALLPKLPVERAAQTFTVLDAELAALRAILDDLPSAVSREQLAVIDAFHLEVYQRQGL
jgi:methylmalonyl-CoA/ethylmalonyl-CoA epimerase